MRTLFPGFLGKYLSSQRFFSTVYANDMPPLAPSPQRVLGWADQCVVRLPSPLSKSPITNLPLVPLRAEKKGVDRVITVGAAEAAGSAVSPSEEAVCLMALCLLGPSGLPPVPCIRILVPTPQVTPYSTLVRSAMQRALCMHPFGTSLGRYAHKLSLSQRC